MFLIRRRILRETNTDSVSNDKYWVSIIECWNFELNVAYPVLSAIK